MLINCLSTHCNGKRIPFISLGLGLVSAWLLSQVQRVQEGDFVVNEPAITMAFDDAKDIAASSPNSQQVEDQVVTRSEFRVLCVYLRVYATWHEVFLLIIGTDGSRTAKDHKKVGLASSNMVHHPFQSRKIETSMFVEGSDKGHT